MSDDYEEYEDFLLMKTDLPVSAWDWLELDEIRELALKHGYTKDWYKN